MKSYLLSIIWISVIVGITELISPHLNRFQKYTKMIGALCVLCVVITPFLNLKNVYADFDRLKESLTEGKDPASYEEYNKILNKYLNEFSAEKAQEEINNMLKEKFGIPPSEAEVILLTDIQDGEIKLTGIQIWLSGNSIFNNPYNIESHFEEFFNCTCEVLIA